MPALTEHRVRVETDRFGPFTLQLGLDVAAIDTLYLRVQDAHRRFIGSPLAQVANQLEKEVVVTSIFGTNSIEGGTLSEEETRAALDLDPNQVADIEQRRAVNLKAAYDLSLQAAADPEWRLDLRFIQQIHATITGDIPHRYDHPGLLRDNPKAIITRVGDSAHGGVYKPPQYGGDVSRLLQALLAWHGQLVEQRVPALIRAPLLHYYYELIHPFWDGNGRVGRVLEATLLQQQGFRYAPFAQARYYFDHIDRYFATFNSCRKAEAKHRPAPNTAFVSLFLEGMLSSLDGLHDRVNDIVRLLLFNNELKRQRDEKLINARQYAIVSEVVRAGGNLALAELRRAPWYLALYARLTDKTKQRDLRRLREQALLVQGRDNRLWPGFMRLDDEPRGQG